MRPFEFPRAAILLGLLLPFCLPAHADAARELLTNGLLVQGHAGQPSGWRHAAFFPGPDAVQFSWEAAASGAGVLKIVNIKPNDSRWVQDIAVSPSTWYHVSGWARAANVAPPVAIGAHLSTAEDGYSSADLRGTKDWQLVEFWMKTGPDRKSVELECRLGGNSAMAIGTAYFRAISFSEGKPPASAPAQLVYAGTASAQQSQPEYPGQHKVLVGLFSLVLTAGVLILLWRFLASPSGRIPP